VNNVLERIPPLLDAALEAFRAIAGFDATVLPDRLPTEERADTVIRLTRDGKTWNFVVEFRAHLTPALLQKFERAPHEQPNNRLLLTYHVAPNMAERLRARHQPFMDTVGNAYIEAPGLFIFVTGQRPKHQAHPTGHTLRLNATGLRLVYLLLCDERALTANYRELAQKTGTALGTVANYLAQLRAAKFIATQGHKRHLVNQGGLFREWVANYPKRLRPQLLLGRFQARDPDWWQHVDIQPYTAYWGGEVAAARLTQYLKPATQTVYTHGKLTDLVVAGQLKKDPRGPIEILTAFWPRDEAVTAAHTDLVHPILVFADLDYIGDTRTDETAQVLLRTHLARYAE
jgi:hypothetical protein